MKKQITQAEKSSRINMILPLILSFIIGCLLLVATDNFLTTINYALVCVFLIIGFIQVLTFFLGKHYQQGNYYNIILGTICIWIALFLYVYYSVIIIFLPIMFSLYAFILGTISLIGYFNNQVTKKINIIISLLSYIMGIILLFKPGYSISLYLKIIGGYMIITSVTYFIIFLTRKKSS